MQSSKSYVSPVVSLVMSFDGIDDRIAHQFKRGYPNLATFTNSDENFAIYRRFGYLQARLLLDKQDQLRLLEEQLDLHDGGDPVRHTRKGLTPEQYAPRAKLLREVEEVFTSYGMLVIFQTARLSKLTISSRSLTKRASIDVKQSSSCERDSKRALLSFRQVSCTS